MRRYMQQMDALFGDAMPEPLFPTVAPGKPVPLWTRAAYREGSRELLVHFDLGTMLEIIMEAVEAEQA